MKKLLAIVCGGPKKVQNWTRNQHQRRRGVTPGGPSNLISSATAVIIIYLSTSCPPLFITTITWCPTLNKCERVYRIVCQIPVDLKRYFLFVQIFMYFVSRIEYFCSIWFIKTYECHYTFQYQLFILYVKLFKINGSML